ncbi:MAG: hypothetical protein QXV17_09230 [Candidatus Micrarchaeaceae archaeon]
MTTITSNKITTTVSSAVSYTYTISLSASQTSLPYTGGTVTLISTISTSPSGGQISGLTVTFTVLTTGSSGTATTDSTGTASTMVVISGNTTTSTQQYDVVASFTDPYTNATITSPTVTITVIAENATYGLACTRAGFWDCLPGYGTLTQTQCENQYKGKIGTACR